MKKDPTKPNLEPPSIKRPDSIRRKIRESEQEHHHGFTFPNDIANELLQLLQSSFKKNKVIINFNGIDLYEFYQPIVDKFTQINPPLIPFEPTLRSGNIKAMTYRTCWILLYNLISPELRTDEHDDIFRNISEKLSISYSQLHKRIINSKITLASKFIDFWCAIVVASLFSLIFSVFKDPILHKNIRFVKKIENDIVYMYAGTESHFLKSLHQNILNLISETFQRLLPMSLTNNVNSLTSTKQSYSINIPRPTSARKPRQAHNLIQRPKSLKVPPVYSKLIPIHIPQYAKKERVGRGDNSGVPITKAEELGKKNEQTMNDYRVTRAKMIHKLCEQEELYYELDDVPPEVELGITFEDFPNPHLPIERAFERSPRLQNYVRKDKHIKRHKYRVIPEPEETMAIIANAHEYLTANPVFV